MLWNRRTIIGVEPSVIGHGIEAESAEWLAQSLLCHIFDNSVNLPL
jgi:hypothetical protein